MPKAFPCHKTHARLKESVGWTRQTALFWDWESSQYTKSQCTRLDSDGISPFFDQAITQIWQPPNLTSNVYQVNNMKKLRRYDKLLIHLEHYVQLLRSDQINSQAYSLIHRQIDKLTKAIHQQWSEKSNG